VTAETFSIISSLATIAVLVVAGVVLRPYLTSYSQKKGETRALREDIEAILDQLRRTTAAQEEIKTALSGSLWVQQGRWTLRRDMYTRLLENLSDVEELALSARNMLAELRAGTSAERHQQLVDQIVKESDEMKEALNKVRRSRAVGNIVLSPAARAALDELYVGLTTLELTGRKLTVGEGVEVAERSVALVRRITTALTEAAREDLLGLAAQP
jgi:hypothetical protein